MMNELLVTNCAAASMCGRSKRSWTRDLACGRIGPEPVRFFGSNSLLWRRSDLEAWVASPKPGGELRTRKEWKLFVKPQSVPKKSPTGLTSTPAGPKLAKL